MTLFFRDDHAEDEPRLSPAAPEREAYVRAVFEAAHPGSEPVDAPVLRIGGASVGAESYRVGDHYVKLVGRQASAAVLASFQAIALALRAAGVPIEPLVPDHQGQTVTAIGREPGGIRHMYVQRFVPGTFFDGTATALEDTLPKILAIGPALRGVPPGQARPGIYRSWEPAAVFARVGSAIAARRASGRVDAFDRLVMDHLPMHERIVEAYEPSAFVSETLHHVDLHPHNLIVREGRLRSVLDLGGFQAVPDPVAIGFCLYKLGRKGRSLGRLTVHEFRAIAGRWYDLESLAPYARIEVARRASLVLAGHYLNGDRSWDRDLRKQLLGPLEIDALFAGEVKTT